MSISMTLALKFNPTPARTSQADELYECRKAARNGDAQALYDLARCLTKPDRILTLTGPEAISNYNDAFKLYQAAAEAGHPKAMSWLGSFYKAGAGSYSDADRALHWFNKALEPEILSKFFGEKTKERGDFVKRVVGLRKDLYSHLCTRFEIVFHSNLERAFR
jgi:hypothetical protein